MLVFFAFYFLGLYWGIQARTTYWGVGRKLLPKDIREQVSQAQITTQALLRLDLYHALQSQGFPDDEAAALVRKLITERQSGVKQPSPVAPGPPGTFDAWSEIQQHISSNPVPMTASPQVQQHISPTPPPIEGLH